MYYLPRFSSVFNVCKICFCILCLFMNNDSNYLCIIYKFSHVIYSFCGGHRQPATVAFRPLKKPSLTRGLFRLCILCLCELKLCKLNFVPYDGARALHLQGQYLSRPASTRVPDPLNHRYQVCWHW